MNFSHLLTQINNGETRALARALSVVENQVEGYEALLMAAKPNSEIPVIGITGPPGAGKSSLVNALANELVKQNKRIAILAVDPSSPFGMGSILGDRLRMESLYNLPQVFIRSVSSRGSLGGLFSQVIELLEILRCGHFDYILIETVGVGQSEVEIAGIADVTILVLVPESGDDIQTIKSGIMEIADIFVVNKSDREGAQKFSGYLTELIEERYREDFKLPVVNTSVINNTGISELLEAIINQMQLGWHQFNDKKLSILAKKVFQLIQKEQMKGYNLLDIKNELMSVANNSEFNLYAYTHKIITKQK